MSDDWVTQDLARKELAEDKTEARYQCWVSSGDRAAAIDKELEALMTDPVRVIEGIGPDGCKSYDWEAHYKAWGQLAHDRDYVLLGITVSKQLFSYLIDKAIKNAEENWRLDDE